MSTNNPDSGQKRPYATLDLKATEIKVTPIAEKAGTQAAGASPAPTTPSVKPESVPLPAPARSYATATPREAAPQAPKSAATATAQGASSGASTSARPASATAASSPSNGSGTGSHGKTGAETVIIKKRGGFFSHLAASLIGGGIALGAWAYGLPQLEQRGLIAPGAIDTTGGLAARLAKLESAKGADANERATEARLAALEKSAGAVAEIREAQSRLVAETKAALAAAASDAGAPEQLERLAAVETRLKAMSEAGATDPNANRMEQLAALTGKVADLETSLATQLTALRKSVSGDVEARVVAANEAAEAAKSGMQRIDREVAGVKTESVKLDERLALVKAEADRAAEQNKLHQEGLAALKVALEAVKSASVKPADITSALAPVGTRIAELEQGLKNVAQAEETRRSNAERVVLALELQNLKRALDRGQKYDAELAEVEKAAGGKLDLAPLTKFKEQGVPTLADLTRDFRPSANAMIDAETGNASTSVVDRLIAGAKTVVRVRRTDYAEGDTTAEAIAARMEKALKAGRLGDVLNEAGTLSPKAKDAAQPFLEKVSARASVDHALASLEGQLKTSLSGASPEPPSKTE